MLRLTLAQMRRSAGRLAAAGFAIVIGTAFVALTLLAATAVRQTSTATLAAQYAQSDLVVASSDAPLTPAALDAVRAVPGVAAADGQATSWQQFTHGSRTVMTPVLPATDDPALLPLAVEDGELPTSDHEVALPVDVADRLGVTVGDTVDLVRTVVLTDAADDETQFALDTPYTVTGTTTDPHGAFRSSNGAGVLSLPGFRSTAADANEVAGVSAAQWRAMSAAEQRAQVAAGAPVDLTFEALLLSTDGPVDDTLRAAVLDAVRAGDTTAAADVVTPQEYATSITSAITGGEDMVFTVFGLVFAAIALLVAGLVIANTFQVLVAQRTRTLALLRCVGADKRTLRGSVLLEGLLLGLIASTAGVALGALLAQVALVGGDALDLGVPLPSTISVTAPVVLLPLAVGTVVTVLAALAPARAATRVAPLEALRPSDAPTVADPAGRARLVVSLLFVVGGLALLGVGVFGSGQMSSLDVGVLIAVAGGALSFVGVVVGAVFWLPKVVALAGRLVGLSGPTARLAAANTLRNPRRTAATSTALVIGVTLVATMSTGAASARATLNAELDDRYFADAILSTDSWTDPASAEAVPAEAIDAVRRVDGVSTLVAVPATTVAVDDGRTMTVRGITRSDALAVGRTDALADGLEPGTLALSAAWWSESYTDGQQVTLTGPTGEQTLTVRLTALRGSRASEALVVPETLAGLDAHAEATQVWARLDEGADAASVAPRIEDALADTGGTVSLDGAAVERAQFERVIDTMLAVVVGLLAAAVIIALIGVANTLSLSVIERRKESATLRAIGLSRGRLRGMLAIEGVLIALVGAVCGVVLGLLYGWAGAEAILGQMAHAVLTVPWRDVTLALAIALVAGLVASVVPGRTAARTSPVAALATE
ncbi:ABC transporter permease [Xylanimonas protaetiae]|uniref:FtsX-like permease family protein n=1 Tax=Xylanimonas protaetiae TaxID=2509457 RepID=A0A4P6FEA5_9MICO|nr:FtsX-like permease family protein [Xylanimonas protaetiae]QAY68938.1 FtsX-like permease family protein [Xylanimonas protaetiae]